MQKKSSKSVEKFLVFEKNPKSKNVRRKSEKNLKNHIENHIVNRKIEIFKIFKIFDFQYDFQWKIFKNIFEIFEIFKIFEIFFDFGFFRKSRNFRLFLLIFFKKKCFNFQSYLNNVATAMLFNRQKHNISKQTCSTKKTLKIIEFMVKRQFS